MSALADPARLELPIEGMTCSSCAARIEKKLNHLEGVQATVNYATERATVEYDPAGVTPEELVEVIEATGYHAFLPASPDTGVAAPDVDPVAPWRLRLVVSACLTLPVLLLSMIEPLQFDGWQWLALQLATPVVLWGAWPFHRAAWLNLRHGDCDDGHAHLARHALRLGLVRGGAVLPRRRSSWTCAWPSRSSSAPAPAAVSSTSRWPPS